MKLKNSFESFAWWCEVFKEPLSRNLDGGCWRWPSAEAEGATDYASDCMLARQLEFSFHVTLVKIIWIFVEMFVFVIVICKIFHCYEHNLECLDVERSKSFCWQGNFLRHSRENMTGNKNHGWSLSDRMKFNSVKYGLQKKGTSTKR